MTRKEIIITIIVVVVLLSLFIISKIPKKYYIDSKYYKGNTFVETNGIELDSLLDQEESMIVFTYNTYCPFKVPCEDVYREFMKKNNIRIVYISFEEFKNCNLYDYVKYAPSIILIKKGRIVQYLDPNSKEDVNRYQDIDEFEKWIKKYIYLDNNKK
jgi:hypothetical protein